MNQAADDIEFPSLFTHANRADWGVSVLSGERDGKRRYLFEGGEERTMGTGPLDLMRKVEHPDRDQQATYARLVALLAKREGRSGSGVLPGTAAIVKQLEKLRGAFEGGFSGTAWQASAKGAQVRHARDTVVPKMRELFAAKGLDKPGKGQRLDALWDQAVALVAESGMSSAKLKPANGTDQQRALGSAIRELLHGSGGYERRFDRFVGDYESTFHEAPSWEAATALPALMSPTGQVFVEPASFRKQLKALSRVSALGTRPNGTAYVKCLGMARAVANLLAAHGEVPRDLLDVHDFIRLTV